MNTQDIISSTIENAFLKYQTHWLKDQRRFKLGLWARQTGKDYTCAAEAVFDSLLNPKTHWLMLACGERQARESLEKAREWAECIFSSASAHYTGGTSSGSPTSTSRDALAKAHAAPADQNIQTQLISAYSVVYLPRVYFLAAST